MPPFSSTTSRHLASISSLSMPSSFLIATAITLPVWITFWKSTQRSRSTHLRRVDIFEERSLSFSLRGSRDCHLRWLIIAARTPAYRYPDRLGRTQISRQSRNAQRSFLASSSWRRSPTSLARATWMSFRSPFAHLPDWRSSSAARTPASTRSCLKPRRSTSASTLSPGASTLSQHHAQRSSE